MQATLSAMGSVILPRRIAQYDYTTTGELYFNADSHAYLLMGGAKGGGGQSITDPLDAALQTVERQDHNQAPTLDASADRGGATITPPPDLVVGDGGFPRSLAFQRTYSSGAGSASESFLGGGGDELIQWDSVTMGSSDEPSETSLSARRYGGPDSSAGAHLGGYWSHNFNILASYSNDGMAVLAPRAGIDAAATVSSIFVLADTLRNTNFDSRLTGIFIAKLFGDELIYNSVNITLGADSISFTRLPDGTFSSPPGRYFHLAQIGERTPRTNQHTYGNIQLTLTDSEGSQIFFSWARVYRLGSTIDVFAPSFKADSWTFPSGLRIDFNYALKKKTREWRLTQLFMGLGWVEQTYFTTEQYVLSSVINNLGHQISFTIDGGQQNGSCGEGSGSYTCHFFYRISGIHDNHGRSVSFGLPGCSTETSNVDVDPKLLTCDTFTVTNALGRVTRYEYGADAASPDPTSPVRQNYRLRRVFTPGNLSTPYQTIVYDELFRTRRVTNIAGEATEYLPGSVSGERWRRGQIIDPLGNAATSVFDERGGVIASIDPIGRTTRNTYDDAGRLVRTVRPEGDAEERSYDVRSNVTRICAIPKERAGSPCNDAIDILTQTTFVEGESVHSCANPTTCNRPSYEIDPRGGRTDLTWHTNGDLLRIEAPAVADGRPQLDYGYSNFTAGGAAFRQLTSITTARSSTESVTTTFSYNSSNHHALQTATRDSGGLNLTTTLTYDSIGNLIAVNGPRSDVTDVTNFVWDVLRRPVMVSPPDPDGAGPLARPKSIVRYDLNGLLNFEASRRDDGAWQTTVSEYDAVGRTVRTTRPRLLLHGGVTYVGDPLSAAAIEAIQLQTILASDQFSAAAYDTVGRSVFIADPEGRATKTLYYPDGTTYQVRDGYIYTADGTVNAADFSSTPLSRGYRSNLLAPGFEALDPSVDAAPSSALIDAAANYNGQPHALVSARGFATTFTYDGYDREVRTTFPDNSYIENQIYDANGNVLQSHTRADDILEFGYDALNRATWKATPDRQERYAYDLTGLRLCAEVEAFDKWADATAAGACTPMAPAADPLSYTNAEYDPIGRLIGEGQRLQGGPLRTVAYEYDPASNRTRITWPDRSEERRVGKECRSRWSPYH